MFEKTVKVWSHVKELRLSLMFRLILFFIREYNFGANAINGQKLRVSL